MKTMVECILTNEVIAASSEGHTFKAKCHVCCRETDLKATWYGAYCSSCGCITGPDMSRGMVAQARRIYLGLTRRQLGFKLGMKTSTIKRYEWDPCPIGFFNKLEELILEKNSGKQQESNVR